MVLRLPFKVVGGAGRPLAFNQSQLFDRRTLSLGLQVAQSRHYVHTCGPQNSYRMIVASRFYKTLPYYKTPVGPYPTLSEY